MRRRVHNGCLVSCGGKSGALETGVERCKTMLWTWSFWRDVSWHGWGANVVRQVGIDYLRRPVCRRPDGPCRRRRSGHRVPTAIKARTHHSTMAAALTLFQRNN
eukprot:2131099-Pyramimonas_sp.AAC.1